MTTDVVGWEHMGPDVSSELKLLEHVTRTGRLLLRTSPHVASQRIPVGLPFLDTKYEGFPPPDDLPSVGWLGVFIPSIIKIIFGVTR